VLSGIMCGIMKDDKYALLERLMRIEGGVDPRSGSRVMSQELWESLFEDELRDLYGAVRHDSWDKLGWCGTND
jgi:hypothetical protein